MANDLHLEFFGGDTFGERVYEALLYRPPASFDTKILVLGRRLSHADAQALAHRFMTDFDAKWHSPKVYQIPPQMIPDAIQHDCGLYFPLPKQPATTATLYLRFGRGKSAKKVALRTGLTRTEAQSVTVALRPLFFTEPCKSN